MAAGLFVTAGLLALPLDAAVNGQIGFQGRPRPVIDRNFHTVVATDDADTLEGASRHATIVAQAASDVVPLADATGAEESHTSEEAPWRGRDLTLLDRVQDWLARANREFQTVIIRRLSVGQQSETEPVPDKTEEVTKEDIEAARERAADAMSAVQAKRQVELEAETREQARLAALAAEQRRESERLKAEAARLAEQQADAAEKQMKAEEAHQRALADTAEKAAEDAKRAAAEQEAQRIAAAKAAEEKTAREAAAREAAEKQRLADEQAAKDQAAKEAAERARQEAAAKANAERQRLADEAAARAAAEKQRLADEEIAKARAAQEAEEKARREAAAKEAAKEAAERQRIAEAEAAKEAAQKEPETKAPPPATPPLPAPGKEPAAPPPTHEAQLVREARNVRLVHGPVVKRWVRRARVGRCRYAGRKILLPGRYVIARGDTLWRIALRHYRSGLYFMRIYRANRDIIRNPNRIYPCQRIYLPRKHG